MAECDRGTTGGPARCREIAAGGQGSRPQQLGAADKCTSHKGE